MMNFRPGVALVASGLLAVSNLSAAQDLDFGGLADVLVERLDPQSGEQVLLVAMPGRFDPLVDALAVRIAGTGAEFLGTWSVTGSAPAHWGGYTSNTTDGEMNSLLSRLDASIMLPGANPGHRIYATIQNRLRAGLGRTIHFHWEGAYDLDGNLVAVDDDIDQLYEATVIHTDYAALASAQLDFEASMRGSTIRVTTPAGTDISFRIGNRPVNRQDGDASASGASGPILIDREIELPAGAIRVAPVETTVNGTIVFPRSIWNGTLVENLRMVFTGGVSDPSDITADAGLDAAMSVINDEGLVARSFREFALGFNPCLPLQAGPPAVIPYYGYGKGIVRLSLGDNSELGGNVAGGYVRWNFFTDATVAIDGVTYVPPGSCVMPPKPPLLIGN